MLNRLKRVLVESFIGTIALGYLLAETILYFVNILVAPLETWTMRHLYSQFQTNTPGSAAPLLQSALPQAARFVVLLVAWYALVRWLYFTPLPSEAAPHGNPENTLSPPGLSI